MDAPPVIRVQRFTTSCGELLLGEYGGALCLCDWVAEKHHAQVLTRLRRTLGAEMREEASALLSRAATELTEFFAGQRHAFDLPLQPAGTTFQQQVWQQLLRIPYGQTLSYGELARRLGKPKAVRAVANACGANALSVLIPCHRVIGSSGSLTGYGGGLAAKQHLLDIETKPRLRLLDMLN